jgi:hypothetical protein
VPSSSLARTGLVLTLLATAAVAPARAVVVVAWDFEGLQGRLPTTGTQFALAASEGMGTMKLVHASSSSFTSVVGNGTPSALSSDQWAVNDHYDFDTSTTGLQNVRIQWSQTSSNSGPADFALFAKIPGQADRNLLGYIVGNNSWSSSSVSTASMYDFDLASFPFLNDQDILSFSLVLMGGSRADGQPGTVLAAGTNRIDNLVIEATPIPAPSPLPLLGAAAAFLCSRRLRRRCRL